MADAWKEAFRGIQDVDIRIGDILESRADATVSPANSHGYMDGGIDLAYRAFFGLQIETRLQAHIRDFHDGELPVGQAAVLETGHRAIPYLVSAPTMRVPSDVSDTVNAYLAFRAALLAVQRHNTSSGSQIRSLLSPALATGVGGMDCGRAARQMAAAYRTVVLKERPPDAPAIWRHHRELLR
jgi:O-acetyl-ADP-ribose deacetylase (regulator of RNase III)